MEKLGVIFDLDGTLWDASREVVPAWNVVFQRYPKLQKVITLEEMSGYFGKTIEEIAALMLPMESESSRLKIVKECCREEQIYLKEHGGRLYPELENTLKKLREKYHLYIVSNCQDVYVQAFPHYHKLEKYFDDIEMSGRTGLNKGKNIALILERNQIDQASYVGDTMGDCEGARVAGIPYVYARYGFGKVSEFQYVIDEIVALPEVAERIFCNLQL